MNTHSAMTQNRRNFSKRITLLVLVVYLIFLKKKIIVSGIDKI